MEKKVVPRCDTSQSFVGCVCLSFRYAQKDSSNWPQLSTKHVRADETYAPLQVTRSRSAILLVDNFALTGSLSTIPTTTKINQGPSSMHSTSTVVEDWVSCTEDSLLIRDSTDYSSQVSEWMRLPFEENRSLTADVSSTTTDQDNITTTCEYLENDHVDMWKGVMPLAPQDHEMCQIPEAIERFLKSSRQNCETNCSPNERVDMMHPSTKCRSSSKAGQLYLQAINR